MTDTTQIGIGHNTQIPTPNQITFELSARFIDMSDSAASILTDARALPEKVTAKNELGDVSRVIIRLRELGKTAESTREAEKGPYWRAGLAVDAFFKEIIARLDKTSNILNRRVNDYQQEQLAAERRRRDEEARETARVAEEARLKAERARKATTKAAAEVEAALTERRAEEAAEATQATAAGMVRERFADGPLVTMKTVKFVDIIDIKLIPLEDLRPYLKPSAIEDAVRRWATATEHRGTMAGVKCGEREESAVR
jgi:hypothetical protein